MDALPHALYRAAQVRELDRLAIEAHSIPGYELMQRAGRAALEVLRRCWPRARRLTVLCGAGNNGGDGYVVARLARAEGLAVRVLTLADPAALQGDAAIAWQDWCAAGGATAPFGTEPLGDPEVVVDGLLGTGLQRPVEGAWLRAIEDINALGVPVLALDVPSGLSADTGAVLGAAVRAAETVTFIGLKQGLFTGSGPEHCGRIHFHDLEVPGEVYGAVAPSAERLDDHVLARHLGPRPRHAHKGHCGHVLVIGGDHGMAGAARLAGEAAARVGAGLVSVATRAEHAGALTAARPELMSHGIESPAQLTGLLQKATVVAVGPGLGQSAWARALLARVLESDRPLVVDADALNLLAREPLRRGRWILTPHPGEAGRLLGVAGADVQADRFAALQALVEAFDAVCVLKGAGTLVGGPGQRPAVCHAGNPGMASGGMGDVLTGVVAGLVAQGLDLGSAARTGAYLHARAGDLAAADGERGLLAMDLMPALRRLANPPGAAP